MVDQPVIRKAKKTLELAVAYNIEKFNVKPILSEVKKINGEEESSVEVKSRLGLIVQAWWVIFLME